MRPLSALSGRKKFQIGVTSCRNDQVDTVLSADTAAP